MKKPRPVTNNMTHALIWRMYDADFELLHLVRFGHASYPWNTQLQ